VTKDTGHSDGKGGGSRPPSIRRNNVLPIDRGRSVARRPWPISASGISLNSGAGLLIVIGVLCGLLISESDRRSPIESLKPDGHAQAQASATIQPPTVAARPAKPSPVVLAGAAPPGVVAAATRPASATLNHAASYTPAKFQATHKKAFGGCTGELELTKTALRFRCPKTELDFPIDEIAKADKDGVVLKSGEKYHFAIANHTKDQAEVVFIAWLSRVHPPTQQASTF
jgi:hypothetical protein